MPFVFANVRSGDRDVDGLLASYRWAETELTYSFPVRQENYGADYGASEEPSQGFSPLTAAQQTAVVDVLKGFSAVANLSFTQVSGGAGDLRFGLTDATSAAHAYLPYWDNRSGDSWYASSGLEDPVKGSYAYFAFLHEIGHAVGLKHAHEDEAFGTVSRDRDAMEYTAMTYRSYVGAEATGFTNEQFGFAQSLMMYDIAALQHMYGANFETNSGNS
ncbi:MAG TPA: hypothetical protein VF582_09385, partial [Allosphingosinicella sp.]